MLSQMVDVLLCTDESPASLAATRALRAAGHRPWVAAAHDTYAARSRAAAGVARIPDPKEDGLEECAQAVAAVASQRDLSVVLPGTEGTLRALTGREHLFPPGVTIGTTSTKTLDRATDKATLQHLAVDAGLDILPAVELSTADLDEQAATLPLPAVVKPLRSVECRSDGRLDTAEVTYADDVAAVRRRLDGAQPTSRWLVQRRVRGTLAAIGGVAWDGALICATHQVSPRIWPVDTGVSSFALTVDPDASREAGVARLVRAIGWSGVFGVQFLLSEGRAYVIDFNPRIYGSIGLAIAAGHNLPAIWLELLLGRTPSPDRYEVGVGYRVEEDDYRALAVRWRRGNRRSAVRGLLPRPRTAHAVFAARDPMPTELTVLKLLARLRP